ncbi:MAG: response regulator [Methanosarcina sp.]
MEVDGSHLPPASLRAVEEGVLLPYEIEALQSLERQHYDIVLMDVKMPEMGGLEATRIIRQHWPHDGPKIITITAYALEGDREKCLEAGMNDYIAKPIQKENLARALKEINRL